MRYDREKRQPDFTALWEDLCEQLAGAIGKDLRFHFKDITTAHQAENRLDDILTLVREELRKHTELSETDRRIGLAESWDRWLEMMAEDNWGEPEGYYVAGQYISDAVDDVIEHLADTTALRDHIAMVELRQASDRPKLWTRTVFLAEHAQ